MRRQVVLPDPDGPRKEKNSPARTARFTCATAITEPNRLPTSINSMLLVASSPTARDYTRARSGQGDMLRSLDTGCSKREYSNPSIRRCDEVPVTKRKVSNPLALAVMACLAEKPMHPYE